MPTLKTNEELFEDLDLITKIDHILIEYNIKKRFPFPFTEWIPSIAWELNTTIEDIENELKKMIEV